MGTARRSGRARGRPLGAPCPAPGRCRPAWGGTAATSSCPWVQRGTTGTPARQSQPGPEHPTCRDGGTAPAGHSRGRSSGQRDPSLRQGPSRAGRGRGQGLPVAVAGTHKHTDRDTCYINGCQHLPRQGGRRGCRGSGAAGNSPSPTSPSPPGPQQRGRDQRKRVNHHPPKPPQRPPPRCRVIGLAAPRTGVERGVGAEPVGHPPPIAPDSSSPYWESLGGAAQP